MERTGSGLAVLVFAMTVAGCSLGVDFDAIQACPGTTLNINGECACPAGATLGEGGDACICDDGGLFLPEAPYCFTCPADGMIQAGDGTCSCPEPAMLSSTGDECVCPDGDLFLDRDPYCFSCPVEGMVLEADGTCSCPAPAVISATGDACLCPDGADFLAQAPYCSCTIALQELDANGECACVEPTLFDTTAQACVCADTYVLSSEAPYCTCPERQSEVTRDVGGVSTTQCECPLALEGDGVFRVPGETEVCSGIFETVGTIGSGAKSVVDLDVLEIDESLSKLLLVEETTTVMSVSLHDLTTDASGVTTLTQVGATLDFARRDLSEDFGAAFASKDLTGLELFELGGELIPVLIFADGALFWVDWDNPSAPVLVDFTSSATPVAGLPDGTDWKLNVRPFIVSGWQSTNRDEASFVFSGPYYALGFDTIDLADLLTALFLGIDARPIAGFAALDFDSSTRTLSMRFGFPTTPDIGLGPVEVIPRAQAGELSFAYFAHLEPVADDPNVFLASGFATVMKYVTGKVGCSLLAPCIEFTSMRPILYEFEYQPGFDVFATRNATDSLAPNGSVFTEITRPFMEETEFYPFTSVHTELSKYSFANLASAGRAQDVVSIGSPLVRGCVRNETELIVCDPAPLTGRETQKVEVPYPGIFPLRLTFWTRNSSSFAAQSRIDLDTVGFLSLFSIDNDILGAPAARRIFLGMSYLLDEDALALVLFDAKPDAIDPLMVYPISSVSEAINGAPVVFSSGAYVFLAGDNGLEIFRVGML